MSSIIYHFIFMQIGQQNNKMLENSTVHLHIHTLTFVCYGKGSKIKLIIFVELSANMWEGGLGGGGV